MSGSANGQVLDHYLHPQFEVIRLVYDNLPAIRAVAAHLTPVEDLVDFQEEVGALYAKLGVLTEASELILSGTPSGIAMLTAANAAAQRQLLMLKSAALREADYFATAAGLSAAVAALAETQTQVDELLVALTTKASNADLQVLSAAVALLDPRLDLVEAALVAHTSWRNNYQNQINGLLAADIAFDGRLDVLEAQVAQNGLDINGLESSLQIQIDGLLSLTTRTLTLESGLVNLANGLSANSLAIQQLLARTTITEGTTTAHAALITQLTSQIIGAENQNSATAMALQTLSTTVTQQGALITATSEFSTQLASQVVNAQTGIVSNATALASLTTVVTQLGNAVTITSEDIVSLRSETFTPGNLAPNAAFEADTHGWSIFNRGAGWIDAQLEQSYNGAAVLPPSMNALSVSVSTWPAGKLGIKSDNLPTRGGQRYILSGWLGVQNCTATLEWRLLNQAGQIIQLGSIGEGSAPSTNINDWPRLWGAIPANADARELQIQVWIQTVTGAAPKLWLLRPMLEEVSGLQPGPNNWVAGVNGLARNTATAVSSLSTRIDANDTEVSAVTQSITNLSVQVNHPTMLLPATATAWNGLSVRIDTLDNAVTLIESRWDLVLDVNGYVTGLSSVNNGVIGTFTVTADVFAVVKPGGGPALTWQSGHLWNKGTTHSVILGQDMATTGDVIFWIGPNPTSPATATKEDAGMYITEDGTAVFRGMVNQTLITSSALELGSTRIHTGGGRLAPFTLRAQGYKGQVAGAGTFSGTVTLSDFQSPDVGTGYHFKRFSRKKADVSLNCILHGDGAAGHIENLYLEVQYDGGGWTTIISRLNINVDNHGGWMFLIRYTTLETWNTVAFRARTTGGKTVVLALSMECDNTFETGNAAGSFSGEDSSGGTTTTPPPPSGGGGSGGPGDGEWCVDYQTTMLPDGRYVRDLRPGDLVETVNVRTGERSFEPLRAMELGWEECFLVLTEHAAIIQSKSTPMDMRDGSTVLTPDLEGLELLSHAHGWEVAKVYEVGLRRVCKPDFGDRMFFAGMRVDYTLATHNIILKQTP